MSQHLDALASANVTRFGIARVKREVAALDQCAGARRAAELLRNPDEDTGAMSIDTLLMAINRMGVIRMNRLFARARFAVPTRVRRIRELTPRQRELVASLLEEQADTAKHVRARRTA